MSNPLLISRGLPAFSAVRPEHVEPAIDRVLAECRAALEVLLQQEGEHSFASLVQPIELMEHRLSRVWSPVSHLNAVANEPELRSAYNACLPRLSDYATELAQNEALYRAYGSISERSGERLSVAQRKLLDDALRDFRLAGVALPADKKSRFKQIMQELSQLQSRFEENVLDATNAWSRHVVDEDELAGLPEHARSRAREEAQARGMAGWLLSLDFPSYHAVVSHAESPALRREFYEAWVTRASDSGPHAGRWDNTETMRRILVLRQEAAQLTGFVNYAEYSLATKMASGVDEVLGFLGDLAERSLPAGRREMSELEAYAGQTLDAWDVAYYGERLRRERYAVSDELLRPYFPVERVLAGLFALVEQLFGIAIVRRDGVDTWHPQTAFYDVRDSEGTHRGGFYLDLYARAKKRGGAWMDECVGRARLNGEVDLPVAYLVCNFTPPVRGEQALLTHDEVVTLFHEFGHALHHLLTLVDFPSLAGINGVPWDAVELPSQFLENFAWAADVLALVSGHHETGEPLPGELFERLLATRRFQAGMKMLRQLEFALFDMRLHAAPAPADAGSIASILAEVREAVSVVPVPDFNRFPHSFSHIFGGGYAAGYYGYKWAEVLSADAFSAFEEAGVLDCETGRRFREIVLEAGGTRDAMTVFVEFRGRRPSLSPLLKQCGLDPEGAVR